MEVRTYRASSMQEALALVRQDLGPAAAVLHTREVRPPAPLRWLTRGRKIEVTASAQVNVPARFQAAEEAGISLESQPPQLATVAAPPDQAEAARRHFRDDLRDQISDLRSMVAQLHQSSRTAGRADIPQELFQLYTDLIDSDLSEDLARELVQRVHTEAPNEEWNDPVLCKARVARMTESQIKVSGPIRVTPGQRRVVALVGPTGVGKTTTIAKLAANFRLRERRKVGLITVDTYRIAAVEQLRTYAEIIDLPMKVVSTPREMREAVAQMADLDLVLMDTAGRSPKDEVKLHELKSFLSEAGAHEVHLVLSSVASATALERTAERFATVGATSLILTKLDESTGLGNVLPLVRNSQLPLSYVTNGQNVPDDIEAASSRRLAHTILGMEEEASYR